MVEEAIRSSLFVLAAFDEEHLVGLIRAVGDGCSVMFLQDILVLPSYQRKGIGTHLMKRFLETYSQVYQIHLLTENQEVTRQFYQSFGFTSVDKLNCLSYTYLG